MACRCRRFSGQRTCGSRARQVACTLDSALLQANRGGVATMQLFHAAVSPPPVSLSRLPACLSVCPWVVIVVDIGRNSRASDCSPTLQARALFRATWQCLRLPSPVEGGRVWTGLRHPDSARGKGYTPLSFLLHPSLPKVDLRLAGGPPSDPSLSFRLPLYACRLLSAFLPFPVLAAVVVSYSFLSFSLLLFLLPLAAEPEHLERSNNAGELVGSPASTTLSIHSLSSRSGARNPLVAVQHLSFSSPAQPTAVVSTPLPMQTSPR